MHRDRTVGRVVAPRMGQPARVLLDTYDDHDEAVAWRAKYAEMLVDEGLAQQYGVRIAPNPGGGWALWLRAYHHDH